jgi:hypothetical protein
MDDIEQQYIKTKIINKFLKLKSWLYIKYINILFI